MRRAPRLRAGRPLPTRQQRRSPTVTLGAAPRLFLLSAGALATAFLASLLYLHFATAIATGGYELHALESRRAELQREHDLLEVQLRRLDAPTRIESEARRLGLAKAARVFVIDTGAIVAGR